MLARAARHQRLYHFDVAVFFRRPDERGPSSVALSHSAGCGGSSHVDCVQLQLLLLLLLLLA